MKKIVKEVFTVEYGKEKIKLFYGTDFPKSRPYKTSLHNHGNAEIHFAISGDVFCNIDGDDYILHEGDAILIPAGVFHYIQGDDIQKHFSFQVDFNVSSIVKRYFRPEFLMCFSDCWKNGQPLNNYIVFICNDFFDFVPCDISPNNDYKYLIGEFFVKNYQQNICVSDLADVLHLSEMQTQRLVKKHTGKTFGENLRIYRMTIADYLAQTTDMTMEEISKYVGYESYSGFWKAHQKTDNI